MDKHPTVTTKPSAISYYAGWFFFILSFLVPLLTIFVPMLGLSKATSALIIGGLLVGGPELIMMIAIAFWGKATFNYFMEQLGKMIKFFAPAAKVSAARYYFGLALLIISFFPSWIFAYNPSLVSSAYRISIVFSFDILFLISFFVLGGEFWEKVRALFIPDPIQIIRKKKK